MMTRGRSALLTECEGHKGLRHNLTVLLVKYAVGATQMLYQYVLHCTFIVNHDTFLVSFLRKDIVLATLDFDTV